MKGKNMKIEMEKILEMMKAAQVFDEKHFEDVLSDLENLVGNELDRSDNQKMELEFAENVQKTILNALEGKPSIDMIGVVKMIVSQAENDYINFKTKYMHDAVEFFIKHLNETDTVEDEKDEE